MEAKGSRSNAKVHFWSNWTRQSWYSWSTRFFWRSSLDGVGSSRPCIISTDAASWTISWHNTWWCREWWFHGNFVGCRSAWHSFVWWWRQSSYGTCKESWHALIVRAARSFRRWRSFGVSTCCGWDCSRSVDEVSWLGQGMIQRIINCAGSGTDSRTKDKLRNEFIPCVNPWSKISIEPSLSSNWLHLLPEEEFVPPGKQKLNWGLGTRLFLSIWFVRLVLLANKCPPLLSQVNFHYPCFSDTCCSSGTQVGVLGFNWPFVEHLLSRGRLWPPRINSR